MNTTMTFYTGWQWLLIDAANQFGLDKLLFEERIEWAEKHLHELDMPHMIEQAETRPLYLKAVMAIRAAQRGEEIGHMVGVDATCSGIQIMSVLTGCVAGAESTGLVNPNERADAYSKTTKVMNDILASNGHGAVHVSRGDAKKALMTSFYGSKAQPKEIFGEDTPELDAFYQAALVVAPGAWYLLQDLLQSWQPYALQHSWKLPDGFDAVVRVMKKREVRIEVDELDHASFTYEFFENQGTKSGLANAANVTHSVDGYVLREMHRRCNYDREVIAKALDMIEIALLHRSLGHGTPMDEANDDVVYYIEQYRRSGVATAAILPFLDSESVLHLEQEHLDKLLAIIQHMNQHKPFPLVTVHDEFKAHANNINWVRHHYREILAEIAESDLVEDLLSQIFGEPVSISKMSFNLPDLIRKSNYALC